MAIVDDLRNRLFPNSDAARAGIASLSVRLTGLGASFFLGVVLARALGPPQFGIYGLATSLAGLGITLALLGTPQLAVREFGALAQSDRRGGLRTLAGSFLVTTCLAASLIMVAVIASVWMVDAGALGVAVPAVAAIPLLAVVALASAMLRGLGAMTLGQVMDISARPILALTAILGLLATGMEMDAALALWIQAAVATLAAIICLFWLTARLPARVTGATHRPWFKAAVSLCAVDLLRQLDGTYGSVLLGWLSTDVELGMLRAAISCSIVVAMPVTILHVIFAPTVSRLHRSGATAELQILLGKISLTAIAIVAAITLGCLLVGRPLINLVFGAAYDGSWAPLTILCVAQLAFAMFGMGPILLAMCHRERQLARIYVLAIACGLVIACLLIQALGAAGVALGQLASLSVIGGLSWLDARQALKLDCSIFWRLTPIRPAS